MSSPANRTQEGYWDAAEGVPLLDTRDPDYVRGWQLYMDAVNAAHARQELAVFLVSSPPSRPAERDSILCPWCGEDQIDRIKESIGDDVTCTDCDRDFALQLEEDGSASWVGKPNPKDREYVEWRQTRAPVNSATEETV